MYRFAFVFVCRNSWTKCWAWNFPCDVSIGLKFDLHWVGEQYETFDAIKWVWQWDYVQVDSSFLNINIKFHKSVNINIVRKKKVASLYSYFKCFKKEIVSISMLLGICVILVFKFNSLIWPLKFFEFFQSFWHVILILYFWLFNHHFVRKVLTFIISTWPKIPRYYIIFQFTLSRHVWSGHISFNIKGY